MKKLFCLLLVFSLHLSDGQEKAAQIDQLLTMLHDQSQFNGNVLIVHKGQTLLNKSYGLANRTLRNELNKNTVFELASLSKQFTATGIVLLHRQGMLAYTDKLTKYFPELKFADKVLIKNLLNLSSGLPEYFGPMMEASRANAFATNPDVVKMLAMQVDSLAFEPNERFAYCNTNYVLLASIIEKVANTSYHDFMQMHVFGPLGMSQTSIVNSRYQPQDLPNYAVGYVQGERQQITEPDSLPYYDYVRYLDGIVGDGMVKSTVIDLRKWHQAIRDHALLNKDEFQFMSQLDTLNDGSLNTYSFGWNFRKTDANQIMLHTGGWPGYVNYIGRSVNEDNLVVILQNFDEVVLPIKAINEILDGKPVSIHYKKEIQLTDSELAQFVGTYMEGDDRENITRLTLGKNALIFNSTANTWDMPIYPDSEITFFSKAPRMNLGFKFEQTDDGLKLLFLQSGKRIGEAKKMKD